MRRLIALAFLAACTPTTVDPPAPPGSIPDGETATLVRVDDGDSLVVSIDGREERVRMIGINAPEQGECFSDVARDRLRDLLSGDEVTLVADIEGTDGFDRLLRYVYADGQLVNAVMAAEGLALARPFEPNTTQQAVLEDAEQAARTAQLGIWNPAACGSVDADLVISRIEADPPGRDVEGEYIEIRNVGPDVDLTGFSVRDESSQHRFEFPSGTRLATESTLRIFTGCGTDTATELYWCSTGPVWDNSGDTVFLVNPAGSIQASASYEP